MYLFRSVRLLLIVLAVAGCQRHTARAATPAAPKQEATPVGDPGWPREFRAGDYTVTVYQPQVESWENYQKATFRAAISVQKKGDKEPTFGLVSASCPTVTDFSARTVTLGKRTIDELRFPGVEGAAAEPLKKAFLSVLTPERPLVFSLDRAIAAVERGKLQKREVKVNLDPPPIFYSDKPAIFIMFMGKPRFEKVPGTSLLFATNTNWDLFMEVGTSKYYLLNGESWLTTQDVVKGPWTAASNLPADLSKLPKDENWQDVLKNLPGKKADAVPAVFVATSPAELIVTKGKPELEPIPGTKIFDVTNTESDLFFHGGDANYYFLAAGRWFRAKELTGPWAAASTDLPKDFADIPADSEAAEVLASVPGTDEAEEAVIQASIPRTATVKRNEVTVQVVYQGEPKFKPIENTTVQYAVNTPSDVFLVAPKYYCCQNGIWFVAPGPNGAWAVADTIPAALYSIPADHPKHNVTYVYVYNVTPETVTVGYTNGYVGEYVVNGLLVFGAACMNAAAIDHYLDEWEDYWHYHASGPWYSYGGGVYYSHYHGGYYRGASYYGPYGGGGRWAGYNPATGTYSRGAYRYGPNGSATARAAYNPHTGVGAAGARGETPYGSWGRGVVSNGEDWVRGGYRSTEHGSVGGIQTSRGGTVVGGTTDQGGRIRAWETAGGETGFVAQGRNDNVYAGHDGNVYKKGEDGSWSKYEKGEGWQSVDRPQPGTTTRPQPGTATKQPGTTDVRQPGTTTPRQPGTTNVKQPSTTDVKQPGTPSRPTPSTQQAKPPAKPSPSSFQGQTGQLNKSAYSRERGNYTAQSSQQARSAPPSRSKSFSGGGRSSGGGGRRR